MTGKDALRETAEKLKADKAEREATDLAKRKEVGKELEVIAANPEMKRMYQESAEMGAKNLSAETPLLKIYTVNKSSGELADGKEPNNGWFYYKPTKQQFETVRAHILSISRGFKAEGLVNPTTGVKGEPKFNQVMAGVIIDEGVLKPFVMYFTGLKLQNLWNFGKEASQYTKMKPVPIPMFALTVDMIPEQIPSNFGKQWIVRFEIQKDDSQMPMLVLDPGLFNLLRRAVSRAEETIASIVEAKRAEGSEEAEPLPEDPQVQTDEEVNPSDIPF